MIIGAIDLGTKFGWAKATNVKVTSGSVDLKPTRFKGGGYRYLEFRKFLNDKMRDCSVIYFEEVRAHKHKAVDAAHVYGGFLGTLSLWCEEHGIPYVGFPVGTIKKEATGKGNAKKEDMIRAAEEEFGIYPETDDEADALMILKCGKKDYERVFL
jgi:Holliday junction resolvasome RuvABC endonuclease subunit